MELDLVPSQEFIKEVEKNVDLVINALQKELKSADVFVGGSFAKGTVMAGDEYDIDVYVRFSEEKDMDKLGCAVNVVGKKLGKKVVHVHGSRDYFQMDWDGKVCFEIVPVLKIKHPKEAVNVTDLSYFHVNYIKRKLKGDMKLVKDILKAKAFCKAQGFYGAESYIGGFSGYALECLVIYFRGFEKMLKQLVKVDENEKLVIDMEKQYRTKAEALIGLNESKTQSPVVLVDGTWKERNALAALSLDTFNKFKHSVYEYFKNPSAEFFVRKEFDINDLDNYAKKKKVELVKIGLKTDKQEGDVAGTKMKKFAMFLGCEISRYFEVLKEEFVYNLGQEAGVYYVVRSRGEVIKDGPPLEIEEACKVFMKVNGNNVFEKKGRLYSRVKVVGDGVDWVKKWIGENKKVIEQMGIVGLDVNKR